MSLKAGFVRTDTDGLVYKQEDTLWAIFPDNETGDPGVCDYKDGAEPVPYPDYWEGPKEDSMKEGYPSGEFYPHVGKNIG